MQCRAMRRTLLAPIAVAALAVAATGCGGDDAPQAADAPAPAPKLTAAQARPAAPLTAGTLQRVPDVAPARERLAFADLDGLRDAAAQLPVARATLLRRVLGATGAATARSTASGTAVQLSGKTTILDAGETARTIHGATGALAQRLADTKPERSAITPAGPSAAQSCLGTTLVQTILGPGTMGDDAALGVGLAVSQDAPAGLQLRICGAPHYIRHLHAMERTLKARFGDLKTADGRSPIIGEQEIGEREIVAATLPADALSTAQLLNLLSGAEDLRDLAW